MMPRGEGACPSGCSCGAACVSRPTGSNDAAASVRNVLRFSMAEISPVSEPSDGTASVLPQQPGGIDPQDAARWHITGRHGDDQQTEGHGREGDRIPRGDIDEQTANEVAGGYDAGDR